MIKTKPYQIRFDIELLEQLQIQAQKENRSMSNLIQTILKDYLNQK